MDIEIYSDVVCDGCLVSLTRLDSALACVGCEPVVRWRPLLVTGDGPSTFDAHRLLWFADQPKAVFFGATADTQSALAALLHQAWLEDRLDLSRHEVLVSLAERVGLDREPVSWMLQSAEGTADVRGYLARAHDLGITDAPTFVVDGRYMADGAPRVATLSQLLNEVIPALAGTLPPQRSTQADDSRLV